MTKDTLLNYSFIFYLVNEGQVEGKCFFNMLILKKKIITHNMIMFRFDKKELLVVLINKLF